MTNKLRIVFLIVTFGAGCSESTSSFSPPTLTKQRESQCPFGRPVFTCPMHTPDCIAPILVVRDQYELAYWPDTHTPIWVCETVTLNELGGKATRKNYFKLDPQIPRRYQVSSSAYKYMPGYDRGHLAAAANQRHSQRAMDETFIVTQIAPQRAGFNRGLWAEWERRVRVWAQLNPKLTLYVISGPIYHRKGHEDDTGHFAEPSVNGIRIPSHFYKIVVTRNQDEWQAIALRALNEKHRPRTNRKHGYFEPAVGLPESFNRWMNQVRWIEMSTGLDFMPNLSEKESKRIEESDTSYGTKVINGKAVYDGAWEAWEAWIELGGDDR